MHPEDYFNGTHISSVRSGGELQTSSGTIVNGTITLYTVAVNFELLLSRYYLTANTSASGVGSLMVYDTTPVLSYNIDQILIRQNLNEHAGGNVIPSLLIPSGYSIRLLSSSAGLFCYGGIIGYRYPTA